MHIPFDYDTRNMPSNLICKLVKSIYGLIQTSRRWFVKLTFSLLETGYAQSETDYSLFTYSQNGVFIVVVI